MTGPRPFVEHAADVLGRAIGVALIFIGAAAVVLIAVEVAARWRAGR